MTDRRIGMIIQLEREARSLEGNAGILRYKAAAHICALISDGWSEREVATTLKENGYSGSNAHVHFCKWAYQNMPADQAQNFQDWYKRAKQPKCQRTSSKRMFTMQNVPDDLLFDVMLTTEHADTESIKEAIRRLISRITVSEVQSELSSLMR